MTEPKNKNEPSIQGQGKPWKILIIGAGIGGLSAGIALRKQGYDVEMIEKDPEWTVYGVGIIQQNNTIRATAELGVIDDYVDAGAGFDHVKIFAPNGEQVATIPISPLVKGYPANMGIARPALQKVLAESAQKHGAQIRLGLTATEINDVGDHVDVTFSDGSKGQYDLVVGADGVYSQTRKTLFPNVPGPEFTGQAVWRYNFDRPEGMEGLHAYNGRVGAGLVPMSDEKIYMYVTTPEPGNPRFDKLTLADEMRKRISMACHTLHHFNDDVTENEDVVYRPLEWLMLEGDWHKGRVVLLGDAVHATTPHLGQGAGLAIEDAIVLADELSKASTPIEAFSKYRDRRFERCDYIVKASLEICLGQLGQGPLVDVGKATAESTAVVSKPI
jgi:2-polyprenyl-6-methoxyphenol hydroxylase-like FAD-dependent oxidoreductase